MKLGDTTYIWHRTGGDLERRWLYPGQNNPVLNCIRFKLRERLALSRMQAYFWIPRCLNRRGR